MGPLAPIKEAAGSWLVEEEGGYVLNVRQPQNGPVLQNDLSFLGKQGSPKYCTVNK